MFGKKKKQEEKAEYVGMPGFTEEPQIPDLVVDLTKKEVVDKLPDVPEVQEKVKESEVLPEDLDEEARLQKELAEVNEKIAKAKELKEKQLQEQQSKEEPKIQARYQIISGELLDNGLHRYTIISTNSLGYVGQEFAL